MPAMLVYSYFIRKLCREIPYTLPHFFRKLSHYIPVRFHPNFIREPSRQCPYALTTNSFRNLCQEIPCTLSPHFLSRVMMAMPVHSLYNPFGSYDGRTCTLLHKNPFRKLCRYIPVRFHPNS